MSSIRISQCGIEKIAVRLQKFPRVSDLANKATIPASEIKLEGPAFAALENTCDYDPLFFAPQP